MTFQPRRITISPSPKSPGPEYVVETLRGKPCKGHRAKWQVLRGGRVRHTVNFAGLTRENEKKTKRRSSGSRGHISKSNGHVRAARCTNGRRVIGARWNGSENSLDPKNVWGCGLSGTRGWKKPCLVVAWESEDGNYLLGLFFCYFVAN